MFNLKYIPQLTTWLLVVLIGSGLYTEGIAQCWLPLSNTGNDTQNLFEELDMAIDPSGNIYFAFRDAQVSDRLSVYVYRPGTESWEAVGGIPGITNSGVTAVSIAINSLGAPYVAFTEDDNGQALNVIRYVNNSWEFVGSAGFSQAIAYEPRISLDDDIPIVIYADETVGNLATVRTFNGVSWELVGNAGFSDGIASDLSVAYSSADTLVYACFQDEDSGNNARVMALYTPSPFWFDLGTPGFTNGEVNHLRFLLIAGVPHIAFSDFGNGSALSVMRFNPGTFEWEYVGTPGFNGGEVDFVDLATDGVDPYVSYVDYDNEVIAVLRFDGTDWVEVGTPFTRFLGEPNLEIYNQTPFLGFIDEDNNTALGLLEYSSTGAPQANITASTSVLDCNNTSATLDASASTGTGTLTFDWSDGSTGSMITVTEAGTYDVTVTDDQSGCTDIASVTIFSGDPEVVITSTGLVIDNVTPTVDLDGSGSFGFGTISYSWSTGEMDSVITVNVAGTYTLTITDANGCTGVDSIYIFDPNCAVINSSAPALTCDVNSINLDASASWNPPIGFIAYEWSTGSTDAAIDVTTPGDYWVFIVTDSTACFDTAFITIAENFQQPDLLVTPGSSVVLDCNQSSVTLDAGGSSGQGMLSYLWSDNSTAESFLVTATGNYSVTITDDLNGCTASQDISVTEDIQVPNVELASSAPVCEEEDLELMEVGGEAISWLWSGPGGFSSTDQDVIVDATLVASGIYSVTGTGANGCSATEELDLMVIAGKKIESNFLVGNQACVGDLLRLIDYSQVGEMDDNVSFNWDFGDGTTSTERDPVYSYTQSGLYTIRLVVQNGACPGVTIEKTVNIVDCFIGRPDVVVEAELNPTLNQGDFRVKVNLPTPGDLSLEIYNLKGQLMQIKEFRDVKGIRESIRLESKGIYFVKVVHPYGTETLKTIVM